MYRRKYQLLPAQPGIVLVSMASPWNTGQSSFAARASGGSPSSVGRYASTLGSVTVASVMRWATPCSYLMGKGSPQ